MKTFLVLYNKHNEFLVILIDCNFGQQSFIIHSSGISLEILGPYVIQVSWRNLF